MATTTSPAFLDLCGGSLPIVEAQEHRINRFIRGLMGASKARPLWFANLTYAIGYAESDLGHDGLPEELWDGVEFTVASKHPGEHYLHDAIGTRVRIRHQQGEWHLVDAYKDRIFARNEHYHGDDGRPVFEDFTAEQLNAMPDHSDNPYKRPRIRRRKTR